jgi:hypothetical protein
LDLSNGKIAVEDIEQHLERRCKGPIMSRFVCVA